ncbi:MAG: glutamate racemase [Atopobiaceae bacterium]|nr:glutamate racemase [Atopobiaceae bacterium]
MSCDEGFIGVFDSGVGGTSVLGELVHELPHEHFVYYGDSANAPYGDKTPEQVLELSEHIVQRFIDDGARAIVIACNTATSCAAEILRARWQDIPIVGVEPALKPAVEAGCHEAILVMATSTTLKLEKFKRLMEAYGKDREVIPLACPGLADRIERGSLDEPDLALLVNSFVGSYRDKVDGVVLGCTHYPFIKNHIIAALGNVAMYDGGRGVAHQLRRLLERDGLLACGDADGRVEFCSSDDDEHRLELYQHFFEHALAIAERNGS